MFYAGCVNLVDELHRVAAALTAAGSSSTFELVAGYDHLFAGMPLDDVEALVDRTVSFLLAP